MTQRWLQAVAGALLAAAMGAVAPALAAQAGAAPPPVADAVPHFDIRRYDVRGNTLLADAQVRQLLAPYTGAGRDFGTIQQAVEALEHAYHARGYTLVLVVLPEQELDQGVVRLEVRQSRLGKVVISGNTHVDAANVRRALPALQEGSTPNLAALGSSLKLANENPARRMEVQLAAGAAEGDVDAAIAVADERPWKAMLNVDNTGTAQSGKTHTGVVLQDANLGGLDHVLSLQYTTALEQPDRVAIYGLGYHVPLYALGDSVDVFASYANVASGTVTAGIFDLAVSGRGSTAGLRYNQNFPKQGRYEAKLVYGIDYKAYRNSLQLAGVELGGDVTVHPASIAYLGAWGLARGDASLGLTLTRNIAGGRHGGQDDITAARSGATAGYTTLRASAVLNQAWAGDWQWRALANAQYTPDALVPGEQFGLGGASTVRGFDERALASDSGVNLNLEAYTPNWCGSVLYQCRTLAFYDAGWLRRNHALPGEVDSTALGSAGLGLRLLLDRYASLQLDYAHVVNPGATGQRDANRLHFRLALSY